MPKSQCPTRRAFLTTSGCIAGSATLASSAALARAASAPAPIKIALRRKVDVLVCGGGPSGVAAAAMAARQGAKTLLLERYGRMGGMAVLAMVGPLMGGVKSPFVTEVLKRVGGHTVSTERLDLEYADVVLQSGASLLLHTWVAETLMDGNRVIGVRAITKQGMIQIDADVVVDATGDGDVAFGAGVAFEQGRPGDGLVQPVSIMYRIGGVDRAVGLLCGSEEAALKVTVPEGTWHDVVTKGQKSGELPGTIGIIRVYKSAYPNERIINATQVNGIDGTNVEDLTRAELEGRKQAFAVLEFLRKHAPGHEKAYISAMPAAIGVRETRRFLGTAKLTREDLIAGRKWPDAIVRSANFVIDIHNPAGGGQAEGFAAKVKPYEIPYGCLVPRDIDGLLLAGRCISGTHDAHASYRVQCIAMATGAAAGAAAAIAAKKKQQPREVEVAGVQQALGI